MTLKKVSSKIPHNTLGIVLFTILFSVGYSYGQPSLPTRTIEVTATQPLQFGTFVLTGGGGGSVVVDWNGTINSIGNIALLGIAPYAQPAIFEIELLQGRNVFISYSGTSELTCSDCSVVADPLTLHIGPTEKGNSGTFFSTNNKRDFRTTLSVGGTLDVPATAIPGTYTGRFSITFNQE